MSDERGGKKWTPIEGGALIANAIAAASAHQGAIDELLFLMDELEKEDE